MQIAVFFNFRLLEPRGGKHGERDEHTKESRRPSGDQRESPRNDLTTSNINIIGEDVRIIYMRNIYITQGSAVVISVSHVGTKQRQSCGV